MVTPMDWTIALIPLLPFAAFVVIGLFGRWIGPRAHWIAVPAVIGSLALSISVFGGVARGEVFIGSFYSWIISGGFAVDIGYRVDGLTGVMLLLVTTVSALVHIYTVGYMHGDKGYARFFAAIALFTFSMLMLVMADNFLQLYVFWEAVGVCSYILIGHWYERPAAAAAAVKAFVVNRVGDFGFGLGILLIFVTFGTLDYAPVFAQASAHVHETVNLLAWAGGDFEVGVITLIAFLLFAGAVGKSAQFPLHVWLPDAMEGPTPISALIHAATMVTAGIFMVARAHPLFNLSPAAMDTVAVVGAFTALFAATIALTQNDIKRIVAYSTVSQLGYMMMACGLGAYAAGIFHLLTHGAFKALLFLGCGSVIHALGGEQDLRKMGGLKSAMPVTYWTFMAGGLALAGIFPFAGFFSKDEIMGHAFMMGGLGRLLWAPALAVVFLTAFYTFRLIFSVFHGESRISEEAAGHLHESPRVITFPLIVLAVLSLVTGWIGWPGANWIGSFLGAQLPGPVSHEVVETGGAAGIALMVLSLGVALSGIAAAYALYVRRPTAPARLAESLGPVYRLSFRKWYVDEIYAALIVRPLAGAARLLWKGFDVFVIDGIVNGVGTVAVGGGAILRRIENGQIQQYALFMVLGALAIIGFYLFL